METLEYRAVDLFKDDRKVDHLRVSGLLAEQAVAKSLDVGIVIDTIASRKTLEKAVSKSNPEYGTRFWRWSAVTVCSGVAALPLEDTSAFTAFKGAADS